MAIEIRETFEVAAPIELVWTFVMDPHQVAACMPGAALDEVVDERTFVGNIRVKVGAVTASYKGRVEMVEVDVANYCVQMKAEGRETGGGTARGTMTSRLTALPGGGTEIVAEASVDLTGRIMQMGRGMIQGVSHQLFLQFVKRARETLESGAPLAAGASGSQVGGVEARGGAAGDAARAPSPAPPAVRDDAIHVLPLLMAALRAAIARLFRRLLGRGAAAQK
jgi:carbon monoxide dehydrogenase subunit G